MFFGSHSFVLSEELRGSGMADNLAGLEGLQDSAKAEERERELN
jgi:hypothetical protein